MKSDTTTAPLSPATQSDWLEHISTEPFRVFDFTEGKDIYGGRAVNIIGDSISQGLNAQLHYDASWVALFRKALSKKFGTRNMGYVSLLDRVGVNEGEVFGREIHTVSFPGDKWEKYYISGNTPGGFAYATHQQGSILRMELNRHEGGIDRHINGFYVYYREGPYRGAFTVQVNGQELAVIEANRPEENNCARSAYIALPEDCPDQVQIDLIAGDCTDKSVIISGISYMDDPDDPVVNNYSVSGIKLLDVDDVVLNQMCKANVVMLTLGTNDCWMNSDIHAFRKKLEIVTRSCRENGSLLIVGNMILEQPGNPDFGLVYKTALREAADEGGGYYLDFNIAKHRDDRFLDANRPGDGHPTAIGHDLIAQVLCEYLDALSKTV